MVASNKSPVKWQHRRQLAQDEYEREEERERERKSGKEERDKENIHERRQV